MMVTKKEFAQFVLVAGIIASGGAAYAAEGNTICVDLNYWNPSVKGSSEMRMGNGTSAKLKNDLGLDQGKSLNLAVRYKTDDKRVWYFSSDGIDTNTTKILSRSFALSNTNYAAGDKVNSALKIGHAQIGLRSNWAATSNFYTNYQINHTSFKTTLTNISTNAAQTRDQSFTSVGIGLGWETKNQKGVNFFAEVTPISLFNSSKYWESKSGIKTAVGKNMDLVLGYKSESIQVGKDNAADKANTDLRGVYFSLAGKM